MLRHALGQAQAQAQGAYLAAAAQRGALGAASASLGGVSFAAARTSQDLATSAW